MHNIIQHYQTSFDLRSSRESAPKLQPFCVRKSRQAPQSFSKFTFDSFNFIYQYEIRRRPDLTVELKYTGLT